MDISSFYWDSPIIIYLFVLPPWAFLLFTETPLLLSIYLFCLLRHFFFLLRLPSYYLFICFASLDISSFYWDSPIIIYLFVLPPWTFLLFTETPLLLSIYLFCLLGHFFFLLRLPYYYLFICFASLGISSFYWDSPLIIYLFVLPPWAFLLFTETPLLLSIYLFCLLRHFFFLLRLPSYYLFICFASLDISSFYWDSPIIIYLFVLPPWTFLLFTEIIIYLFVLPPWTFLLFTETPLLLSIYLFCLLGHFFFLLRLPYYYLFICFASLDISSFYWDSPLIIYLFVLPPWTFLLFTETPYYYLFICFASLDISSFYWDSPIIIYLFVLPPWTFLLFTKTPLLLSIYLFCLLGHFFFLLRLPYYYLFICFASLDISSFYWDSPIIIYLFVLPPFFFLLRLPYYYLFICFASLDISSFYWDSPIIIYLFVLPPWAFLLFTETPLLLSIYLFCLLRHFFFLLRLPFIIYLFFLPPWHFFFLLRLPSFYLFICFASLDISSFYWDSPIIIYLFVLPPWTFLLFTETPLLLSIYLFCLLGHFFFLLRLPYYYLFICFASLDSPLIIYLHFFFLLRLPSYYLFICFASLDISSFYWDSPLIIYLFVLPPWAFLLFTETPLLLSIYLFCLLGHFFFLLRLPSYYLFICFASLDISSFYWDSPIIIYLFVLPPWTFLLFTETPLLLSIYLFCLLGHFFFLLRLPSYYLFICFASLDISSFYWDSPIIIYLFVLPPWTFLLFTETPLLLSIYLFCLLGHFFFLLRLPSFYLFICFASLDISSFYWDSPIIIYLFVLPPWASILFTETPLLLSIYLFCLLGHFFFLLRLPYYYLFICFASLGISSFYWDSPIIIYLFVLPP